MKNQDFNNFRRNIDSNICELIYSPKEQSLMTLKFHTEEFGFEDLVCYYEKSTTCSSDIFTYDEVSIMSKNTEFWVGADDYMLTNR